MHRWLLVAILIALPMLATALPFEVGYQAAHKGDPVNLKIFDTECAVCEMEVRLFIVGVSVVAPLVNLETVKISRLNGYGTSYKTPEVGWIC